MSDSTVKKPIYKRWWFITLAVLMVLGIITAGGDDDTTTAATATTETATPSEPKVEKNDPEISKAEFTQIKTGMTETQVYGIIGSDGEVMSESEVGGYKTVMKSWEGDGLGANANVMFQNGKVVNKAQFGLE